MVSFTWSFSLIFKRGLNSPFFYTTYIRGETILSILKIYERVSCIIKHYRSTNLHITNLYDNHKPFSSRMSQRHESSLNLQSVVKNDIIWATNFPRLIGAGKLFLHFHLPLVFSKLSRFLLAIKTMLIQNASKNNSSVKYCSESLPNANMCSFFCAPIPLLWFVIIFIFHLPVCLWVIIHSGRWSDRFFFSFVLLNHLIQCLANSCA